MWQSCFFFVILYIIEFLCKMEEKYEYIIKKSYN